MQKIYCYVDETGHHNKSEVFIVGVVAVPDIAHDELIQLATKIEQETGKRKKWSESADEQNHAYMQQIILSAGERMTAYFELHRNPPSYLLATVNTTAYAIHATSQGMPDISANVVIDGLAKSHVQSVKAILRKAELRVNSVRGLSDTHSPFLRLADAVCGLVRDAVTHADKNAKTILRTADKRGFIREAK